MNAQRRNLIKAVLADLADLRGRVETIQSEEQDAFDNMPESLQATERGQANEAASEALDEALSAFDEIGSSLNEAMA
ncbi:hypothetical protein CBP36_19420 (plasmid) [Acidovorax carolinensis]|uniref:Chemotaxis protein n=1 Tax=Acidovorax carolinensis TaxID=553814 RepID=A0A240UI19_9BURK|nr:hypothetical protein [Acidovorax carolinensis]ART57079.1 hypothetical protein CBP35_19370 [Acidovorax carolinensis]ART61141.1 hypothetical protein CBP36_19420 [Acidovorax carolinensis]